MVGKKFVHIIGAGPAGLVAAINLAKVGCEVIVHEKKRDVGTRFHGDFQGLDNWSMEEDVPEFLESIGIKVNFLCHPYFEGDFYGPDLQRVSIKTPKPFFYLVERGRNPWSLDQGLKKQALELGVEIRWNENLKKLPKGKVIVGTGPKAADAIAKGMVFNTSHADLCIGFMDDQIAPKAYAYLLVHRNRATFATCLFEDFQNEWIYFRKAVAAMHRVVDIDVVQPREFGGFVNFFLRTSSSRNEDVLYVGENAGFQDALWGFGMKPAMLSGYLAARSIINGESYNRLCKKYISPFLRTSLANRWLFFHLGNRGYSWVLNHLMQKDNPLEALKAHFKYSLSKRFLFQIARRWYRTRLIDKDCMHVDCNCVWCRCGKEACKSKNASMKEKAL